jgi:hypothetical protein
VIQHLAPELEINAGYGVGLTHWGASSKARSDFFEAPNACVSHCACPGTPQTIKLRTSQA